MSRLDSIKTAINKSRCELEVALQLLSSIKDKNTIFVDWKRRGILIVSYFSKFGGLF